MDPVFNTTIMGCPEPGSYAVSKRGAVSAHPAFKGRSRYTLKDLNAVYETGFTISMSTAQFYAWQLFWASDLNYGVNDFTMDLWMDDRVETMTCHALGPFNAVAGPHMRWLVSLNLEARFP